MEAQSHDLDNDACEWYCKCLVLFATTNSPGKLKFLEQIMLKQNGRPSSAQKTFINKWWKYHKQKEAGLNAVISVCQEAAQELGIK